MMPATDDLRSYIGRTAGLRLEPGQACYAESRLAAVMRAPEAASLAPLLARLDPDGSGPLARELIEALTCRETWFFRDRAPFEEFARRLAGIQAQPRAAPQTLRIWSAGCASGQEVYSLAMCLEALHPLFKGWRIDIIGTDICETQVERARRGEYSPVEIQRGLPMRALLKHVEQLPEPADRPWRMRYSLRHAVRFQTHNLLGDCGSLGIFDIIFCRNVLTQLHLGAQRQVLANLAAQLAQGGCLVVGKDEHPYSLDGVFSQVGDTPGVFERRQFPLSKTAKKSHLRLVVNQ